MGSEHDNRVWDASFIVNVRSCFALCGLGSVYEGCYTKEADRLLPCHNQQAFSGDYQMRSAGRKLVEQHFQSAAAVSSGTEPIHGSVTVYGPCAFLGLNLGAVCGVWSEFS